MKVTEPMRTTSQSATLAAGPTRVGQDGFTMVEIALSIAIVAFAMVAQTCDYERREGERARG